MKILVTGATGFVGSHLVHHLLDCGYQVKAIVRKPEQINNPNIEVVIGDIRDKQVINDAVSGCQQIYHIAAKTSRSRSSKQDFFEINVEATRYLAKVAVKAQIEKFVYASTIGVYGILTDTMVDERSPTYPNNIYRRTKLAGEKILLSYYQEQGLPVVIARLSSMVGSDGLNWLGLTQAISTQKFKLLGTGKNKFNIIHVDDAVRGLRLCGESNKSVGNCYLIGSSKAILIRDFVTMIADNLGVNFPKENKFTFPFEMVLTMAHLLQRYLKIEIAIAHRYEVFLSPRIFNTTKASEELGFVPQLSLEQGVKEMVESLRDRNYL